MAKVERAASPITVEPAGHRILIRPDKVEDKTAGGIILTDNVKEQEQLATAEGVIVAIGRNAWKAFDDGSPWAAVGDRVMFATYSGRNLSKKLKDQVDPLADRLVIVNDEDVISVIR